MDHPSSTSFIDILISSRYLSASAQEKRLETKFEGDCTIHGRRRWRQKGQLGHGGSGVVYLEKCITPADEEVGPLPGLRAVKEVYVDKHNIHPDRLKFYARELEALAHFSQPQYEQFFVQSSGWFDSQPRFWGINIAMEYLPEGDLKTYLAVTGCLPTAEARIIIHQLLQGLRQMHKEGFAHRDLKPENILIKGRPPDSTWHVKIADFGISKRWDPSTRSVIRGTLPYMPPELLSYDDLTRARFTNMHLQQAADIWAIGEITVLILTGSTMYGQYVGTLNYQKQLESSSPEKSLNRHGSAVKSFVTSLLKLQAIDRPTAAQALNHAWITRPSDAYETLLPSEPNLASEYETLNQGEPNQPTELTRSSRTGSEVSPSRGFSAIVSPKRGLTDDVHSTDVWHDHSRRHHLSNRSESPRTWSTSGKQSLQGLPGSLRSNNINRSGFRAALAKSLSFFATADQSSEPSADFLPNPYVQPGGGSSNVRNTFPPLSSIEGQRAITEPAGNGPMYPLVVDRSRLMTEPLSRPFRVGQVLKVPTSGGSVGTTMPFSSGPADVQSLVAMQQNTSLSEEITIPSIALQGVVHSYGTGARLPSLYTTALSEAGVRSIWEGPADLTLGLDLSPTGDFLVSSLNGRLYVVESFSGREIVRGQPIAFSNDKTRLAFFTPKTGVALLNIASRKLSTKLKLLHPFEPSQPKPSQCAENGTFSPYDHHLAWRCDDGRSLVIWDIATGTIANEIRSATDQLAWKFHPLTRQLLFCSTDHWSNSPQRWTAEQNVLVLSWYDKDTMGYVGSMLLRPKGFDFLQLPQLLFSADGEHLGITFATDLGSKLKVFNLDGDAVCEIQSHKRFSHIQACPSGTFRLTYEGDEPDVLSIMVKRIEKMKTQTWFWQRDNDWYGVTDTHGRKPALINQRTGKSIALPFFAHRSWFRRKQLMKEGKVVAWSRDGTVIAMQYDIREEESGQGRMIAIWKLAMHTKAR